MSKIIVPKKQKLHLVQAFIDASLFSRVNRARKKRKITIKQALIYGLETFLRDIERESEIDSAESINSKDDLDK